MKGYEAPLREMHFIITELVSLDALLRLPGYEAFDRESFVSILDECGAFSAQVLAPLNRTGDREGSKLTDGRVVTPNGWREAYRQFSENGWMGIAASPEWGGQGLPSTLAALAEEMWNSANMSFALAPMLTRGAIDALQHAGSEELKERYLPNMVSGKWTGTMNLTEPQAGSDLAAVQTRAIPLGDGTYRLTGQKIFITYGDHDLAENIVHLVLARIHDAPPGVKGISLFLVPKVLVNDDGSLGARNDVSCVSLEHKLGIHASPTCVMVFGGNASPGDDASGAVGWIVGEEGRGLECMFVMMNAARLSVGIQGIGIAERAYQQALRYARERRQGSELGSSNIPIVGHPDVRRMLLTMKATVEAMRGVAVAAAVSSDIARGSLDIVERRIASARVALLIPIIKGWCTESSVSIASLGIQIQGGMGYIEETGAAQYLRDARILPIYEGTTGIQALDLVGRKVLRDDGCAAKELITEMQLAASEARNSGGVDLEVLASSVSSSISALSSAVEFLIAAGQSERRRVLAAASPFLRLFGIVCGGWQLLRAATIASRHVGKGGSGDDGFYGAKVQTALFYVHNILSEAEGLAHATINGGRAILDFNEDQF